MVPLMTLTSLWQTPAATMRTLTSVGPGALTSSESVISVLSPVKTMPRMGTSWVRDGTGSARPDDALHLGIGVQPKLAAVSSDAAHLEAAKRRLVIALGGVDADVAAAQLLGDAESLGRIAREHVVVQAVVGVVGQRHALLLVVE